MQRGRSIGAAFRSLEQTANWVWHHQMGERKRTEPALNMPPLASTVKLTAEVALAAGQARREMKGVPLALNQLTNCSEEHSRLSRRLQRFRRRAIRFFQIRPHRVSLNRFALSRSQHLLRQIDGSLHMLDCVSSSCSQTACSCM